MLSLSLTQTETLQALVNRLIPADAAPSAWALGVGDYLAQHWTGDLAAKVPLITQGLSHLNEEAQQEGTNFASLPPQAQDALISHLEQGQNQVPWPADISPSQFVETMII